MKKIYRIFSCLLTGVCLLSVSPSASAQQLEQNYALRFTTGSFTPAANSSELNQVKLFSKADLYQGFYFRLVQFHSIPDNKTRAKLENAGIKLLQYFPNNAYFTAIPENFDLTLLQKSGVRSVIKLQPKHKLAASLLQEPLPNWALRGNNEIELNLKYYENLAPNTVIETLRQQHITVVDQYDFSQVITIRVPKTDIFKIAALPFVFYVEPIDAPAEPENYRARTNHRSNAIDNEFAMGRHYNGAGVNVALGDDGIVGPHIDYQGREYQAAVGSTNNGDHGDHVAGIIMGAGNLDPKGKGMADGADLYVYNVWDAINRTPTTYNNPGIRITSTSYGNGCNAGYNAFASTADRQTRTMPSLIHVFSAGNSGTSNCGYGAGSGWGNITGGVKVGKNVLAVANVTYTDGRASSSSRGPAHDGRIKPDISAVGTNVYSTVDVNSYDTKTGTSMACPGVSGTLAQLYQAYKELNNGQEPESALMKAIILNTADDLGNIGPDYSFGWGRINALRAVRTLENDQYLSATISQGNVNNHTVIVPANVKQVKVMINWTDYEAAPNAAVALINNLNMQVTTPAAASVNPWVLNHTASASLLNATATRGTDNLNNMEQVSIDNPVAGTYTVTVTGAAVPQGPQKYYLTYEFLTDEVEVTYPIGGEGFVPGEVETIRWDAYGNTGNFTLQFSTDSGTTWNAMGSATSSRRYYDWSVPNNVSGKVLVRVSRGSFSDVSDATFAIVQTPRNLRVGFACPDSVRLLWDVVPGAIGYEISKLGTEYMDSIGASQTNAFVALNSNPNDVEWYSVRALVQGNKGRRAVAIQKLTGIANCPFQYDVELLSLQSPASVLTSCNNTDSVQVAVRLENKGVNPIFNIPIAYQLNNGAVVTTQVTDTLQPGATSLFTFTAKINLAATGNYNLTVWASHTSDANQYNDTISQSIRVATGTMAGLPFFEDFQQFGLCSSASNCEVTVCNLANGFMNEQNGTADDIDWRTWASTTPSSGTGPSGDHTTGNGRFLYLESSDCFNKTGSFMTPCIDLSNAVAPEFSFWYHMYGVSMGELHVDLMVNNGWLLDVVPPLVGNRGNMWREQTLDLTQYVGQVINIRFRGVTGVNYTSDIAIDDIAVKDANDIGIAQVVGPISGCGLQSAEQLCVQVQNNGTQSQSNIPVAYRLNNGNWITDTVPGPLAAGMSTNFCFTNTLNLATPGTYDLQVYAALPTDILQANDTISTTITSRQDPGVGFTFTANGNSVVFTDTSTHANTYFWDFGDGGSSNIANPTHIYGNSGQYLVTLTVTAANGCTESISKSVSVVLGMSDLLSRQVMVYPNPTQGKVTIKTESPEVHKLKMEVYNIQGQLIKRQQLYTQETVLDLSNQAQGTYILKLVGAEGVLVKRIIVQP